MNKVILIGRLIRDPELRYTESNKAVCNFSIAIGRGYKEDEVEQVDFINCIVWNNQAENLKKYQTKGNLISVEGSLRVEQYQDNEGNNKYKTYVLASNISYLSNKKESNTTNEPTEQELLDKAINSSDPYKDFGEIVENENSLELSF